ncbi:hypothetical protein MBM_09318 [Drepanopeziza brunnea f. sp. 'multigermtubi' MB_m1]|uniref:Uncharacterized protein n=1 Tax=Marssonina brunnea f. sp. multigermtubi (strain MB_m1) TaxID=1072389 RepID=K1WK04_MARBU|nr:uncharacterized protein MBM_09318 [Drepanopeziza brunnea f. sp. 'multigermtubi' MB_m1]EKD12562.1 hypothetical protein MBM_09318 [Drepanopeziza brunnea f. sp. 'multigermtubi' MB_m1]
MSIPFLHNAIIEVNPFSIDSNKLINEIPGRYKDFKGRKGFIDEFGIKHYGANKESAQVLCLLDHFVSFLNAIGKQFTHKDVKVRLILGDPTLELFDSDHAEAKSILKELLMPYPFTIDSTLVYKRLTLKFSDENEFKWSNKCQKLGELLESDEIYLNHAYKQELGPKAETELNVFYVTAEGRVFINSL